MVDSMIESYSCCMGDDFVDVEEANTDTITTTGAATSTIRFEECVKLLEYDDRLADMQLDAI